VSLIDLHCHILPGIDDGAGDRAEALAMARLAVADGIATIVATPHQLGPFAHNRGDSIRAAAAAFQLLLEEEQVTLRILPGAELRIEPGMVEAELAARLASGELLTLANQGRHVLLDLPERVYVPLDRLLVELAAAAFVPILAHPERNREILARPEILPPLVQAGCLLQVTAGSLLGEFGDEVRHVADRLVQQGVVQFVASDAHHIHFRKPLLAEAFAHLAQLAGVDAAERLCHENPAAVAAGQPISALNPTIGME